jgi:tyrosyl-tRNA synthetase
MEKKTLDQIVSESFGTSRSESRRTIGLGGVRIDGEVIKENIETTEEELAGSELSLGRNRKVKINKENK